MWMREAARREKLPDIDKLDDPRYFPYRYGQALWAYIGGRFGDEVIGDMLRAGGASRARLRRRRSRASCRSDSKELSKEWHNAAVPGLPANRRDHQDARGGRALGDHRSGAKGR